MSFSLGWPLSPLSHSDFLSHVSAFCASGYPTFIWCTQHKTMCVTIYHAHSVSLFSCYDLHCPLQIVNDMVVSTAEQQAGRVLIIMSFVFLRVMSRVSHRSYHIVVKNRVSSSNYWLYAL
ncbi:uncharacterized protein BJX67DRAFT_23451 [Aspergillus lucknowensis]|uniref:Uncharacterized protein n=1 Tax=Aspergillus lucknowensis TaxID=176173 RepID=A0ABR4LYK9_9EURO